MRRSPIEPPDELQELRRLLLSREQRELSELRERLGDKQLRAREVAGVLPHAIKLSRGHGEELTRALQPAVEGSVRESIAANPHVFGTHSIRSWLDRATIDRRKFAEPVQSFNQSLEQSLSWQRVEMAFRSVAHRKQFCRGRHAAQPCLSGGADLSRSIARRVFRSYTWARMRP